MHDASISYSRILKLTLSGGFESCLQGKSCPLVSVEVENDDGDALDSTATIPRPPSSAFVLGYTWRRRGDNAAENDLSFLTEQVIISSISPGHQLMFQIALLEIGYRESTRGPRL